MSESVLNSLFLWQCFLERVGLINWWRLSSWLHVHIHSSTICETRMQACKLTRCKLTLTCLQCFLPVKVFCPAFTIVHKLLRGRNSNIFAPTEGRFLQLFWL